MVFWSSYNTLGTSLSHTFLIAKSSVTMRNTTTSSVHWYKGSRSWSLNEMNSFPNEKFEACASQVKYPPMNKKIVNTLRVAFINVRVQLVWQNMVKMTFRKIYSEVCARACVGWIGTHYDGRNGCSRELRGCQWERLTIWVNACVLGSMFQHVHVLTDTQGNVLMLQI